MMNNNNNNNNNKNNNNKWVDTKIFINDDTVYYNDSDKFNLYQLCLISDWPLPRFCYHEKLSIAGNCRVCLVELEDTTKPILSCATLPKPDLSIYTDTAPVKDSQEAMFEYLLINHPLDCPICDQGGECDSQDQTIVFGSDRGRFYEVFKRAVEDRNYGPLIKTVLNRCIHCSRCIRFLDEIAGSNSLVFVNRGMDMQISSYIEKFINSELSGNIIDLCPVGALTSKPYSFMSRLWETFSLKFVDILDATHSNIEIHMQETKVLRITPEINDWLNEDWISDKIRFSYDSWMRQRLLNPWFYNKLFTKRVIIGWKAVFIVIKVYFYNVINFYIKKKKKFFLSDIIIGDFLSVEDLLLIKKFSNLISSVGLKYAYQLERRFNDLRFKFLFNMNFYNLSENNSSIKNYLYLLIAINPRYESPILNIKLKSLHPSLTFVVLVGFLSNFNYEYIHFGTNIFNLFELFEFSNHLMLYIKKFTNYFWIFGTSFFFKAKFGENLWNFIIKKISYDVNLINLSHGFCSDATVLELNTMSNFKNNFLNNIHLSYNIYYYLNSNFLTTSLRFNKKNSLLIYQGWQGDYSSKFSGLLLPTRLFIEKPSVFINTEGLVQNLREFSYKYDSYKTTKFDSQILFVLLELFKFSEYNSDEDEDEKEKELLLKKYLLIPEDKSTYFYLTMFKDFFLDFLVFNIFVKKERFYNRIFKSLINNFYLHNSILRNSKIMSMCSKSYTVYNDSKYIIFYLIDDS